MSMRSSNALSSSLAALMFAVLTMSPEMSHGHWLLITLTAGVGGSLLSIGSAAGVALMGLNLILQKMAWLHQIIMVGGGLYL